MPVFVKQVGDAVPTSGQPDEMRDDSARGGAVAKVVDPEGFKAGGAEVVELLEPEPLSIGVGRGTSLACGFHMCVSVVGPTLLGLPYAMSLLGWPAGITVLVVAYFTTLWTTHLVSDLVEYKGVRYIRYRDLAEAIVGFWGKAIIWPCQWANLIGFNISILIQAGLSMQGIYQLHSPGATDWKLWQFISLMGALTVISTQLPTLHSLRFINGFSMIVSYTFATLSVIINVYQGHKYNTPKDYGVHSNNINKAMGALNGIVIVSFAYGNTIIPEIAATAKPPAKKTMNGAILVLYTLLALAFFPAAISGYWAYGYALVINGVSFLPTYYGSVGGPTWLIYIILVATLCNAIMALNLYNGPVLEYIETKMYKREDGLWAVRNWLFRTSLRTLYVVLLTLVAALFPYFGDILGLIGAIGVTPVDFIMPFVLALKVGKIKGMGPKAAAYFLMILYTGVGIGGTIASIRNIALDASKYSVFANLGVAITSR